ncbi:hypothetical protein BLL42_27560 (plasmid) [Pseudomonas frederiksbergensis]|uniref:Uncharacterized protein n=1 Tax=Pseudomonas frederiksbergensis TaxID=104087 RepID=A0A1J0EU22_9PSED|nr:hypothetical protein [Pseudomonas frederiksbergensis]APC19494.1 hypothetical protein BLL42_27560 [Pseudomonas frederiksbergensis]
MSMTKLENTLINLARSHLNSVLSYYEAHSAGDNSEEAEADYMGDHGALFALLELGHISDSGIGTEAKAELLEIEAEHAAAVPWPAESESSPPINVDVRYQDGRLGTVDVSEARHTIVLGGNQPD